MGIELVYHIWSPGYRHGSYEDDTTGYKFDIEATVEDPLHYALSRDAEPDDETTRQLVEHHKKVHEAQASLFGSLDLTWPYSTHINVHGAAVNGILAGEKSKIHISHFIRNRCSLITLLFASIVSREGLQEADIAMMTLPIGGH